MKSFSVRRLIPPLGPIFSLTLIGALLLSAILYYRAVKIQRFLEPALAISEPRMRFSQDIKDRLAREFDAEELKGLRFRAGSIVVDQSLLFAGAHQAKGSGPLMLQKLSRVFLAVLGDEDLRKNISLILVNSRLPRSPDAALNKELRFMAQERAVVILNALFSAEPKLENYAQYFAPSALPVTGSEKELALIEFRIIPTEQLHIEVLQRLEQYAY